MEPIQLDSRQQASEVVLDMPSRAPARTGPSFGDMIRHAIESVNHLQHESGRLEDAIARGESVNLHQAIIAGEKAGLSFRLMMQVRNKLVDAYQEIMRMQV